MITWYLSRYIYEVSSTNYAPGMLKLTAGSQHVYEKDQAKIKKVLDSIEPFVDYPSFPYETRKTPSDVIELLWFAANSFGSLELIRRL